MGCNVLVRHREGLWPCYLVFLLASLREEKHWLKMDWMNKVLNLHWSSICFYFLIKNYISWKSCSLFFAFAIQYNECVFFVKRKKKYCIFIAWFSVILNGSLLVFSQVLGACGWGVPFSPICLCLWRKKLLSCFSKKGRVSGFILNFEVGRRGSEVWGGSQLLSTDGRGMSWVDDVFKLDLYLVWGGFRIEH